MEKYHVNIRLLDRASSLIVQLIGCFCLVLYLRIHFGTFISVKASPHQLLLILTVDKSKNCNDKDKLEAM